MAILRFLHIPKTAGTSFLTCLCSQYDRKNHFVFAGDIDRDIARFNSFSPELQQRIELFTGHAPIFTGLPQADNATIITFLRDPVSRVKSFLQHVSEGKSPDYCPGSFDLDKFLASGTSDLSNLQTKMLINKRLFFSTSPIDSLSKSEARDLALHNLFHVVTTFGLQEFFDESLLLFSTALQWSTPFYIEKNKMNPHRRLEFKPHHIERIAELNSIDIEVYNAARAHFLGVLEGPDFDPARVASFRRENSLHSPRKLAWLARRGFHMVRRKFGRLMDRAAGRG